MRKIVYYVATSLDGFISGPGNDVSLFSQEGSGVSQYLEDLKEFDTCMMGRNTYEFGYEYGMEPGQPAYPHMKHYIFSNTLTFKDPHKNVRVLPVTLSEVKALTAQSGTDIYLCGGGVFAGWLLDHNMIDILKIKLNPILLGEGVPIFGRSRTAKKLALQKRKSFDNGLEILTYDLKN